MSVHLGIDELADAAGGVLDDARTQRVETHLQQCASCQETYAALSEVPSILRADPAPTMPQHVASRLHQALAAESRTRAAHSYVKPTLGSFGTGLPKPRKSPFWLSVAAACAAAGVVGFAGYFLSASAGLNEPPATAPAVLSSGRLGPEAGSLEQRGDLSPHRFSEAWRCARAVTNGRVTGITSAVVDGQLALLVYTRGDGINQVTVVKGCGGQRPAAGPSTTLPR